MALVQSLGRLRQSILLKTLPPFMIFSKNIFIQSLTINSIGNRYDAANSRLVLAASDYIHVLQTTPLSLATSLLMMNACLEDKGLRAFIRQYLLHHYCIFLHAPKCSGTGNFWNYQCSRLENYPADPDWPSFLALMHGKRS